GCTDFPAKFFIERVVCVEIISRSAVSRSHDVIGEHARNASGISCHDHNAVCEKYGFVDRMSNKDARAPLHSPDLEQLFLKFLAGHCIEGSERLIKQQNVGAIG